MLTDTAYLIAMGLYLGAGLLLCLLLARWLARRPGWRLAWFLTAAALLLTPAFPEPGMNTLAPAAVVAGFQLATAGVDSALHALRPLALALGAAWVLALLAGGMLWLRRRSA